ncbi:MAG: glycosyltransferase family 4 protein [Candidatus Lokiarchaeota archaeon]|nr:glycosyltransferase family 4 protein [Candidatus Lokiarchaeota archaeon]
MNICLVSLTIPPDRQDGAAKFFRGIYDYLKKQGHNVVLITGKWGMRLNDPNIFQIKIIKKRFMWMPQFTLGAIKYLRSHRFDIVHGNAPKGTLPIILSNTKNFITTIHDLGPFETRFSLFPIEKNLIKYVVRKAKNITTCSESIRREIKYYNPRIELDKIVNLYSAIETKFKPLPEKAKNLKEKLRIKGPVLLYIGRIAHYKGIEDIIRAYEIAKEKIPDLTLVVGGKPDFIMKSKYESWKRIHTEIKFVGFVSEEEIPAYYSMGDVFVTYSHASEGFGLTPIEAIACGTLVICSSLPAYKEVLEENGVFVPPKKPDLLAEKIVYWIKNPEKRNEMVKRAQQFIKRYSWDEVGRNLEKLYLRFVDGL